MKIFYLILIGCIFCVATGFAQTDNLVVVKNISSIATYTGNAGQLFVNDSITGGVFHRYDGQLPVDGGIVFKDKAGVKWKRNITDNRIKPEWFGAGSGLADNYIPFMKAINFIYATYNTSGGTIPPYANAILQLSGIRYNFKQTLIFNKHIKIEGQGTRYEPTTILYFPANTPGLKFTMTAKTGGFSVDMKNVMVGMDHLSQGYDSMAHAISINCVVNFENVTVNFASGNGIHIDACANTGAPNYGMSDGSIFLNCKVQNCNNGVYINGCDANQIVFQSLWAMANRRWGIYDNGFLGNHYYNPQCDFNGNNESVVTYGTNPMKYYLAVQAEELVNINQKPDMLNSQFWKEVGPRAGSPWKATKKYYTGGAYAIVNINAYATVFGAYTEEGEAPALLNHRVITIGGDQGSGVVGGKYLLANNDGLLLTSNLILTGQHKLGLGTVPETALDINYKYRDSYIPYIARFRCDDCESSNLLFANSSSDFGVLGYFKKSFLTIVDRKYISVTDSNGIHPYIANQYNLGSNDLRWNTVYANNWRGGVIQPKYGGTGLTAITPNTLFVGGNSTTDPLKQLDGSGIAGQVLMSNGPGNLPGWKTLAGNRQTEMNSNGLMPPKMTTAERNNIKNPVEGSMIYNTSTHKLNIFTGTVWEQLSSN
jgi:hypothetical protein